MNELDNLFYLSEDAVTTKEAELIDSIWSSSTRQEYHDEADQARADIGRFYKAVKGYGLGFALKACRLLYGERFSYYPFDCLYSKAADDILEEVIKRLEAAHAEAGTPTEGAAQGTSSEQVSKAETTFAHALEAENKQLRARIEELEEQLEDLKQKSKGRGVKSPSSLNRNERTALLIELLAVTTGVPTEDLTGVSARIQGQGASSLGRACELITDISEGQGRNTLNQYRVYQIEGEHEKIRAKTIDPARSHIRELVKQIKELAKERKAQQRGKG